MTKIQRNTAHVLVLLVLALSVVVVATSIAPSTAEARARLQNTTPLMGDPTDTEDGPQPTVAKAASTSRTSALSANGTFAVGRQQSWYTQLRYLLALAAGHLKLMLRI